MTEYTFGSIHYSDWLAYTRATQLLARDAHAVATDRTSGGFQLILDGLFDTDRKQIQTAIALADHGTIATTRHTNKWTGWTYAAETETEVTYELTEWASNCQTTPQKPNQTHYTSAETWSRARDRWKAEVERQFRERLATRPRDITDSETRLDTGQLTA